MIQRINFIQKEGIKITYANLLIIFGVAIFISLSTYGVLLINQAKARDHFKQLVNDIERLKKEREKLISKEEALQGGPPAMAIQMAMDKEPPWHSLLNSLSHALPPNVWLVSFKTSAKEDSPSKKGVLLNGSAKNPAALAYFLRALEESPYFERVVLTSSKEEIGLFNFSASCDISLKKRR